MPATKPRAYQVYDIDWKQAVRALSDSNINLASPGALVIDAVVLDPYDRVLLTAQTNATENGIYQVNAAQTLLVPAPDWVNINSGLSSAVNSGLTVTVTEGADYAQTTWTLTNPNPIVIGVTAIVFEPVPEASDRIGNIYFDGATIELANGASETAIAIRPNGASGLAGITIPDDAAANLFSLNIFNFANRGNVKIDTNSGDWVFDYSGNLTATGYITANYFVGDGGLLSNISSGSNYSNANVANYLPTYSGNLASLTGNVTTNANISGSYILGNGRQLSGIDRISNGTSNIVILDNGNVEITSGSETWFFINSGAMHCPPVSTIYAEGTGEMSLQVANNTIAEATINLGYNGAESTYIQIVAEAEDERLAEFELTANDGSNSFARIITFDGNSQNYFWKFSGEGIFLVPGDIIPVANGSRSLGNVTNQWDDLYVSNNTIYLGNVPLAVTSANGLTIGGQAVLSNGSNAAITTTGNINANYFFGNGSQLTGINVSTSSISNGNSNVAIATANGNVTIAANASSTWTFSNTGTTTFPTGVRLSNARGPNTVNFTTDIDKSFQIETQTNVTSKLWNFTTDGNLTLPQNGNINFSNGVNILSNLAGTYGNANVATFLAAYGSNTISTTGNITANYFFGYGVTAAAANSSVQLISNNENTQVRVDDANVEIYTSPNGVTQYQWSFGNNGVLGVAGNINFGGDPSAAPSLNDFASVTSAANFAIVADSANSYQTWNFDSTGNLTIVHGSQIQEVASPVPGNYALALRGTGSISPDQQLLVYPTSIDANHLHLTSGNLYNTELFLGNDDLYVKLANTGNVVVNTNDGVGNTAQYTFDSTGNLTLPGGMTINGDINTLGSQTALLQPTDDLPLSFIASGANGTVTSFWAEDVANLMSSNIAAVYTPLQNTQTVRIVTGTNGGNIAIYDFDKDGVFSTSQVSATGNVSAAYLVVSGGIRATGASPAPTLSGFSSISTVSASGNITASGNIVANANVFGNFGFFTSNITAGNITVTGNVSGNYFLGNGAFLTGLPAGYSNANVANYLPTYTGNITAGNITVTGNIAASNILLTDRATFGDSTYQTTAWTGVANTYIALGTGAGGATQSQTAVAIGVNAGNVAQDYYTVAIGIGAGQNTQLAGAIAIGAEAGGNSQGTNSIAIGFRAGRANQANNSIVLNGTGANLNNTTANSFVVAPIRNTSGNAGILQYNDGTKEVSYSSNITGNLNVIGGNISGNTAGFTIGYRDIPQVSFAGNTTISTTDAGKHFYSTQSTNYILTIANNASQGFAVGAAITIVNQGTGNITIAQGSGVSLYLAGNATSGNRTLTTFGMATLMKVATDTWFINGSEVV